MRSTEAGADLSPRRSSLRALREAKHAQAVMSRPLSQDAGSALSREGPARGPCCPMGSASAVRALDSSTALRSALHQPCTSALSQREQHPACQ